MEEMKEPSRPPKLCDCLQGECEEVEPNEWQIVGEIPLNDMESSVDVENVKRGSAP